MILKKLLLATCCMPHFYFVLDLLKAAYMLFFSHLLQLSIYVPMWHVTNYVQLYTYVYNLKLAAN